MAMVSHIIMYPESAWQQLNTSKWSAKERRYCQHTSYVLDPKIRSELRLLGAHHLKMKSDGPKDGALIMFPDDATALTYKLTLGA